MSIQPNIIVPSGTPQGTVAAIADLGRRIDALVATVGYIAPGAVSGTQVASGTLTGDNIVTNSITATQIATGTIVASNIAAQSITAALIAANTITGDRIAANTITATNIAAATITTDKIAANTITAGNIAANTITSAQIATGAITSGLLATGAVTAGAIAAGAVTAGKIDVGAVVASNINVATLSAVSTTMGSVTGGIFQTSATGARAMMGTSLSTSIGTVNGIVGIDGSNNVTFFVDAATGNVTLKGTLQSGSSGLGNVSGITQNAVLSVQGNNLIDNQQPSTGDLTPFTGTNATLTIDTSFFLLSPSALKAVTGTTAAWSMTAQRTGPAKAAIGSPSTAYSTSVLIYTTAARAFTIGISWYTAANALISTTTSGTITSLANQWQRVAWENQTAPGTAAFAVVTITGTGHAAGESQWLTNFIFTNQKTATGSILAANSVSATEILAGTITAQQIAALTITAANIAGNTITGNKIAANTIAANNIAASTITANELSSTAIDTVTVTLTGSGQIRTAASAPNIILNNGGMTGYDAAGNYTFRLTNTGTLAMNFNNIVNGTFDSNANGWEIVETGVGSSAGGVGQVAAPGTGASGGAGAVGWPTVTAGTTLQMGAGYIAVPVTPGQVYTVNVKLMSANGVGQYYVRMNESNAATLTTGYVGAASTNTTDARTGFTDLASAVAQSTIQTSFQQRTYTYTVPAGVTWVTLAIYNWTGTNWLYMDDVEMKLQGVPPANTIRAGNFIGGMFSGTFFQGAVINGGTITGTNFVGVTLTGGTVQTAASGARTAMVGSANGVFSYNASNAILLGLDPIYGLRMTSGGSVSGMHTYGTIAWYDTSIQANETALIGNYQGGIQGTTSNVNTLFLTTLPPTAQPASGSQFAVNKNGLFVTTKYTGSSSDGNSPYTNVIARCINTTQSTFESTAVLVDGQGRSACSTLYATFGIRGDLDNPLVNAFISPFAVLDGGSVCGTNSGTSGSPASINIYLTNGVGGLPGAGFTSNTYPVLKTSYNYMYFSAFGAYSSYMTSGGVFTAQSSKAIKQAFKKIKHSEHLDKIDALDLHEWEFKTEPGVRRHGPFAEDFNEQFGLGESIKDPAKRTKPEHEPGVAVHDVAGVALAGVQGLYRRIKDLEAKVAALSPA